MPINGDEPTVPSDASRRLARDTVLLLEGDVLSQRYEILSFLGKGGMGAVYEARDRELDVTIALKTLAPHVHGDPAALRDMKREVLLARQVTHPNVCRLHDLGWDEKRRLFFATMELLPGETLAEWLSETGPVQPETTLPIARQIARGLEAAHGAGVVHRDIKAGNVMLVPTEVPGELRAVLTDFGLASSSRGDDLRTADASHVAGTPAYMAPEQLRGEAAGPAADLYAFGVLLYQMVTDRLPFTGPGPWGGALRKLTEDPPPPREHRPDLPEAWQETILRCMARDPQERFGGADLVIAALEGRGESAAREARARGNLPAERDSFVGREADLQELAELLQGPSRLVSVMGIGGTGKTRLALHLARRHRQDWPGGTWFCDLSEARSVEGIVAAVAAALGVPLRAGDPVTRLGHAIASHERCLVILDNFEQVAHLARETLGHWLDRAEEARFVVTTRQLLGLAGERVFNLDPLSSAEAVELFIERAEGVRRGFRPTEEDREAIAELVELLDLLPLAIEIAAARVATLTPAQIVQRAGDRFRLLTTDSGRRDRQATLRATLDWSWDLLDEDERAALAQLSVFEGGFTVEAAEAVLDLEELWPVDALQSLANKSLVISSAADRFDLLASVREYAAERLDERSETPEAEARHGAHFARLGEEEALRELSRRDADAARRRIDHELDNLVSACRRAVERKDGPTAVGAFRAAWYLLSARGPATLAEELGESVLGIENLTASQRVRCLRAVGAARMLRGKAEAARASLEEALAIADEEGSDKLRADTLLNLGGMYVNQGRFEEARQRFLPALEIARANGDRYIEAGVLLNLALLHGSQGRLQEEEELCEQVLAMARDLDDARLEAVVLGNIGNLHGHQGRWAEARQEYEQALALKRRLGDRSTEGHVLGNIGNLLLNQGRLEEARAHYEQALAIERELGDRSWEGTILGYLGGLHKVEGREEEAQRCYEQALAIHRERENRRLVGPLLCSLGGVLLSLDRAEEARVALDEGEQLLRDLGDKVQLARLLCQRARLEWKAARAEIARAALREAEDLAVEMGVGEESQLHAELREVEELIGAARTEADTDPPEG